MPPPLHGAAVMGQSAARSELVRTLFDVTVVPIRINSGLGSLQRFNLAKVWSSLHLCAQVGRALLTTRPSTVYFTANISGFAFWRDLLIVLMCRAAGVRRIFHFHMKGLRHGFERSWLMRAAYRLMFHDADVVHLSQRLYRDVEPVVPPGRFHVVANGVDVNDVIGGAAISQNSADPPTILFLSNLYESKGPLDLLEASQRVAARGIGHKLVFAGAGPEPDVVSAICRAGGHVTWAGPVEGATKAALLREAAVFAFPSYYHFECQPLVVIEAMAYGKAIIASDEAAIRDLVSHGVSGLIVRPRAIDELAEALARLLSEPTLRERFGIAARANYARMYTAKHFERRLAHALLQACAPAKSHAVQVAAN